VAPTSSFPSGDSASTAAGGLHSICAALPSMLLSLSVLCLLSADGRLDRHFHLRVIGGDGHDTSAAAPGPKRCFCDGASAPPALVDGASPPAGTGLAVRSPLGVFVV